MEYNDVPHRSGRDTYMVIVIIILLQKVVVASLSQAGLRLSG